MQEQYRTNLAFFGESPSLSLSKIEEDFFASRSKNDLTLYMLFTKEDRALLNDERLIPELRGRVFDSIARLYQQIGLLMNDSMTGMFRREQMYNYLQEKIRGKSLDEIRELPLTIAAADFAGLGYFNKQSHAAGDAAIQVAARSMKESLSKEQGLGFRTGGDEFTFVIKEKKAKATQLGERMKDRLLQIDTSNSQLMNGFSFELPLRIDLGYTELSEGVDVYSEICTQLPGDRMCIDQEKENAIVDLAYQIADQRSMMRKNISLIQFLVSKYEKNSESFKSLFSNATLKKPISLEELEAIAEVSDKAEQVRIIAKKGFELSQKESAMEEESVRLKKRIIKEKAEEQLQQIIS